MVESISTSLTITTLGGAYALENLWLNLSRLFSLQPSLNDVMESTSTCNVGELE